MEEFDKLSDDYLKGFNSSYRLAKEGKEDLVGKIMRSFKTENEYTKGFMDGATQNERDRLSRLKEQSKSKDLGR